MYQPQVPLIAMSPGFRAVQLAEVELGRLVLLRPAADIAAAAGIGLRADALSAQGDLTVGVLRLRPTRFERCALDDAVIAIDIDYLLEADLASAVARVSANDSCCAASSEISCSRLNFSAPADSICCSICAIRAPCASAMRRVCS